MIDLLRTLDPNDLSFHAERYDSAAEFKALIELAHEEVDIRHNRLVQAVRDICDDCLNDGSSYGMIPCLGGEALKVWERIRKVTENREITEFLGEGYQVRPY